MIKNIRKSDDCKVVEIKKGMPNFPFSYDYCFFIVNSAPLVKYGLTPQLASVQYDVNVQTYDASYMCKDPANDTGFWAPGYMYDAVLKGLKPNTKYFYAYGTEEIVNIFEVSR